MRSESNQQISELRGRLDVRRLEQSIQKILRSLFARQAPFTVAVFLFVAVSVVHAQSSPWETEATRLSQAFTGTIAKGFSLVAIVLGGLMLAFSEAGGKRAIGGLVFGCGLSLSATNFMTWLFS
jgi:type IV secretory pathway VirB2 component (pilin)